MKKLLSLFCAMALLSGCSSFGTDGGLFGGSECESKEARDFMENAEANVFFAFDSSALSMDATEVVETQVKWLKKHDNVDVVVHHAGAENTRRVVRRFFGICGIHKECDGFALTFLVELE